MVGLTSPENEEEINVARSRHIIYVEQAGVRQYMEFKAT